MRSALRVAPALLASLASLCCAAEALAHDPPQGTGILWAPGDAKPSTDPSAAVSAGPDPGERMIIETNRGLMVSSDGQASFQLLCSDAVWGADAQPDPILVGGDGQLSVATFSNGLVVGAANLCDWHSVAGPLGAAPAFDLVAAPGAPDRRYLLASTGPSSTGLFVTDDAGASWNAVGTGQVPYTRVRLAPSNPARLYRSAVDVGPNAEILHKLSVSSDGGQTATEYAIPLGPQELQARLLAVDPSDPDRVYLHVEATSLELPERLIVTTDAGQSFATLATLPAMNGFAMSPDGQNLWVGGATGLWRSTDRGATFVALDSSGLTRVGCLDYHQGLLYACGVTNDDFNISVSSDGGASFRRVLAFPQVTTGLACPGTSTVGPVCQGPIIQFRMEVSTPGSSGTGGVTDTGASGTQVSGAGAGGTSAPAATTGSLLGGSAAAAPTSAGCDVGDVGDLAGVGGAAAALDAVPDPLSILAATAALVFGILSRPPKVVEPVGEAVEETVGATAVGPTGQPAPRRASGAEPSPRACPARNRSRVYRRPPRDRPRSPRSLRRSRHPETVRKPPSDSLLM